MEMEKSNRKSTPKYLISSIHDIEQFMDFQVDK